MAGNLYLNVGSPYVGTKANQPPNWTFQDREPNDYDVANFALGDLWLNMSATPDPEPWVLVSKEGDSMSRGELATWVRFSGGGTGSLISLTGNSGGPVFGDVNQNVNVVGDGITIDAVGVPASNTITLSAVPGAFASNFPVPNGTSPVVPSAAGAVTLTSSNNSVQITGGLNTIDFLTTSGVLYTVQTTDATPTAMVGFVVPADVAITMFIDLTASDSVYAQSLHSQGFAGGVYPAAGAFSIIGVPNINILTNFGTATVDIVASGNSIVLQVTGEVATTINWIANVRTISIDI